MTLSTKTPISDHLAHIRGKVLLNTEPQVGAGHPRSRGRPGKPALLPTGTNPNPTRGREGSGRRAPRKTEGLVPAPRWSRSWGHPVPGQGAERGRRGQANPSVLVVLFALPSTLSGPNDHHHFSSHGFWGAGVQTGAEGMAPGHQGLAGRLPGWGQGHVKLVASHVCRLRPVVAGASQDCRLEQHVALWGARTSPG